MPLNFKDIFDSLKQGVSNLAENSLKDFVTQAKSDGQSMLDSLKESLQDWTSQLAAGDITGDDFKFLVLGQKDLLEVVALKEAGLALAQADAFKEGVLNLVVTTILDAVKL